ncbi:hypothetical protein GGR04_004113 [Aureimonas pseudogalii]|uniref:Uncharacterized protein n=1 Tax=Aureimonas pseudogalii TaxID=1744844 RepID=A0A7W6H804_9HYPH|nr:hypothetical protein [Aureimonas pseudogalii]
MNMVDSVTTMGWSRSTATKNPLKAPTAMPVPMPMSVQRATEASMPAGSIRLARTALTSEITAPAERSKPPERTTSVWPMAARARAVPPLAWKLTSK